MVDTAGHCVSNGAGRFYTNWIFVPGYSSSATGCTTTAGCFPFGKWTARQLITTAEWHTFANLKQDLGYAVLNTLGGKHIANLLGGQGSQFNLSRKPNLERLRLPAGCAVLRVRPEVVHFRAAGGRQSVDPAGAAGGPHLLQYDRRIQWRRLADRPSTRTGLGFVNSHNSYRYTSGSLANANVMYGPYYGSEALSLFNCRAGSVGIGGRRITHLHLRVSDSGQTVSGKHAGHISVSNGA